MNQLKAAPKPPFFWNWARKVLCWPFIMRGVGPLCVLIEGCCRAADDVLADMHWLVEQFNPKTCELEYVDRFGAARGLVRHLRENEIMWRKRVCAAYLWHKLAGRKHGMPKILAHFGYTGAEMINRAAIGEPDLWAHFKVDLGGQYPFAPEDYNLVNWIINETKPAKSILDTITLVIKPKAESHIYITHMGGSVVTIGTYRPPVENPVMQGNLYIGWQSVHTTIIKPKQI